MENSFRTRLRDTNIGLTSVLPGHEGISGL